MWPRGDTVLGTAPVLARAEGGCVWPTPQRHRCSSSTRDICLPADATIGRFHIDEIRGQSQASAHGSGPTCRGCRLYPLVRTLVSRHDLGSRVRKAQPGPICVLVGRGQGFLGAALLPRRVKFARAARSAQSKREGWQKSFSRAPITSPPTIRSDPHGMSKLNRNMCVRQFPSSNVPPTPRSVTTSCFRLACL